MALKSLSQKPTSQADYAWSDAQTYSRTEFTELYPLGVTSAVLTIGREIASNLPRVGWIVGITNAFSALTSIKKQQMINGVYTQFVNDPDLNEVNISAKFRGYQKGSQGWFWLPDNDYSVSYN